MWLEVTSVTMIVFAIVGIVFTVLYALRKKERLNHAAGLAMVVAIMMSGATQYMSTGTVSSMWIVAVVAYPLVWWYSARRGK